MARRNYRRGYFYGFEGWVPPAVGLTPEDFPGEAVFIEDVVLEFKQRYPDRIVKWGVDTVKDPAELWADINAADMREAIQVAVKLIKWIGRNGFHVFSEDPIEQMGPNTWRFKYRIKRA